MNNAHAETAESSTRTLAPQDSAVVLGLLVMGAALFGSQGIFHLNWLWALPTALFLFFFQPAAFIREGWEKIIIVVPAIGFGIATFLMTSTSREAAHILYSEPDRNSLLVASQILLWIAAGGSIACLTAAFRQKRTAADLSFYGTLLFLGFGLVTILFASPRPWIDVWTVQEEAANAFIHGINPYTFHYYNIYPAVAQTMLNPFGDIFVYMPGVIYLMAPFKYLGLDTRLSLVFFHLISALLLLSIGQKSYKQNSFHAYLPVLLFAIYPLLPYMTDQGWNDTFSITFLILCFWSLQNKSWFWFLASISGMFLIKQHIFLFLPLFAWVGSRTFKKNFFVTGFLALLPGLLLCVPFLIWGWRDFLGSLYGLQFLNHPGEHLVPDRIDAFNLLNWITQALHLRPSFLFPVTTVVVFFGTFWKMRESLDLRLMSRICGCGLLAMFIFAPASFVNYYWFVLTFFFLNLSFTSTSTRASRTTWTDVLFLSSRCFIVFSTNYFYSETALFHDAAVDLLGGNWSHLSGGFLPFALIPSTLVQLVQEMIPKSDLLTYRTLFILFVGGIDTLNYLAIRKQPEVYRGGFVAYVVLSTALFLFAFDSLALLTGLIALQAVLGHQSKTKFVWSALAAGFLSAGSGLALVFGMDRRRFAFLVLPLAVASYVLWLGTGAVAVTSFWALAAKMLTQVGVFAGFQVDLLGGVATVSGLPDWFVTCARVSPFAFALLFAGVASRRTWSTPWIALVTTLIFAALDPSATGAGLLIPICLLPACRPNARSQVFVAGLFVACGAATIEFRWLYSLSAFDNSFWNFASVEELALLFTLGWAIFALPPKFQNELTKENQNTNVAGDQDGSGHRIELHNV